MFSHFKTQNYEECYIVLEPIEKNMNISDSIKNVMFQYANLCREYRLDNDSLIYVKIFLSDIANQAGIVSEFMKKEEMFFYFLIGQPPASGSKISMESYHIKNTNNKIEKEYEESRIILKHNKYTSIWGSLVPMVDGTSYEQTRCVLNSLDAQIKKYNGIVRNNVIRTWFYIRDIDNNYQGMVNCRREWFERAGMTKKTNYIASTGIEGYSMFHSHLVRLDYLAAIDLTPEQITYMSAPENMNPTHEYGVTFERGTRITFGDCSHYYISGTASIDNKGNILYPTDIIKQTERTFTNIEALLKKYDSGIDDLKIILVYVRDYSEYGVLDDYLKSTIRGSIPYIILKAPVCRPGWLVEAEGIAKNPNCNKSFENFM